MANIKDLKKKIKSTKGTFKITQAMKLVSAAKLSKAQQAITASRPYANELEETIKVISALVQGYQHKYLNVSENKQSVLLVLSSDKGLCGGYNSQLAKKVTAFVADSEFDFKVNFLGKKVKELVKDKINLGKHYTFENTNIHFSDIQSIASELGDLFKMGEIGRVYIAYNIFNSAISFTPTVKQLLPLSMDEAERNELNEKYPFDFKYEPAPSEILDSLIPESFITAMYTCYLDALAAEHGSRMSSMDSAANNCKEAISTLTLKMNKLRQAAITTELIEVVSGAESLNS